MQIWQSSAWPNFTHDPAKTEAPLTALAGRLGTIEGLQSALTADERHETLLRAVTNEALASFAIEGAALPTDQIAASVLASLTHRHSEPQHRTDAIAELMLEAREGQGALTQERLFTWHRLLFHGIEIEDKGAWRSFPMVIARRGGRQHRSCGRPACAMGSCDGGSRTAAPPKPVHRTEDESPCRLEGPGTRHAQPKG